MSARPLRAGLTDLGASGTLALKVENRAKQSALWSVAVWAALMLVGVVLYMVEGDLFWGGYLAMSTFYGVMFYLGASASRTGSGAQDPVQETLLAGRSLGAVTALMTMTATWVGGGFVNGTAESVATHGLAWAQAPWGYALSLVLGGLLFAKPMRRRNFTTLLDPMSDRFGERMAGVLYIPALLGEVFWTGAILSALGATFGFLLGMDFSVSIVLSAAVAIAYTALGGMRAVAKTDVFQLAILMGGLLLALPFVLPEEGVGKLWSAYQEAFPDTAAPWPSTAMGTSLYLWWDYALLLVFGGIPWHVYFQRVLSSRDGRTAQVLSIGAGGLCLVAAIPCVLIGMVSATTDWGALGLNGPPVSAVTLPYVLSHLTPPLVATLGMGALAAAVMSSVDSSILSASSMGAWNIYRPLIARESNPRPLTQVVQRLIWIIGIGGTLIALKIQSVYALWFLCSDFVYCILFPQLVAALFDRRANLPGSAVGFGVATVLRLGGGEPVLGIPAFLSYPLTTEGVSHFPFRTFSMVTGLVCILLVSRLTGRWFPPKPLVTRPLVTRVTGTPT